MSGSNDQPRSYEENLAKVRELVREIDICMLTTVEAGGKLSARPMSNNRDVEFDGDLWFFSSDDSHKAHEIENDNRVNVSFADTARHHYVSIAGTAEIIRDKALFREHWTPAINVWFPDGIDSPGLILLKITAQSAEYWESPGKVAAAFAIAKGLVTRTQPDLGENQSVALE